MERDMELNRELEAMERLAAAGYYTLPGKPGDPEKVRAACSKKREELSMGANEAEYEASCCECGSDDFDVRPYDFGMDRETGYSDSGERATCRNCGFSGEFDGDFKRKVRK